jgi:hypothetical protein
MKIWFDTEFIDTGTTIDLISIGMVKEGGATYYAESSDCHHHKACDWVKENVLSKLIGPMKPKHQIADEIKEFVGPNPEFWGYFSAYDWIILCQLYGRMLDVPNGWPHLCMDVKQLSVLLQRNIWQPETDNVHNALNDALWTRDAYYALVNGKSL